MSDEREDWDALIHSPGWSRLLAFVKSQWGSAAYQQKIERALSDADEKRADALAAIKVVNATRQELDLILNYPQERVKKLDELKEQNVPNGSRRGML